MKIQEEREEIVKERMLECGRRCEKVQKEGLV